jgi:hypothetical protein
MMKTLVILLFTGLFALGAQAQYVDLRKVNVGAFIGPNISNYNMQTQAMEADSRFGYQIGGFLRYGGRFYLQSGLTYVSVNSRLSYKTPGNITSPPAEVAGRVNSRMLQLPILGGANLFNLRRQTGKVRLQAGPAFSLLTRVRDNELNMDRDDFRNIWAHALAGVGLDVWFFSLDFGYQWGLSNAFANDTDGRHRMASLSLGITF